MNMRSRQQIIAEMLGTALEPTTKTTIMYKAGLSYTQLQAYLSQLSDRQMIENRDGLWIITERGRAYLKGYQEMTQIID